VLTLFNSHMFNLHVFNTFNDSFASIVVVISSEKCAHRMQSGVRERQTCISLIYRYRSDIFRLENLGVWQIPVFRYGWPMRNRGNIEFETFENSVLKT
jgi:hypothetical protein